MSIFDNIWHQFKNVIFIPFVILKPKDHDMWLGGNDLGNEGVFVWESSASVLSYTNWSPGIVRVIKHFLSLSPWQTRLECLFLVSFLILV
jgi:hypothetical protein